MTVPRTLIDRHVLIKKSPAKAETCALSYDNSFCQRVAMTTSFAERVRYARRSLDITQKELAQRVGVTQQTIAWLEDPKNNASGSRSTTQIATACGVRPEWLANGTEPMTESAAANEARVGSQSDDEVFELEPFNDCGIANAGVRRPIQVPRRWLDSCASHITAFENLRVIRHRGQSMAPTLHDGDLLVLDVKQGFEQEGVYVLSTRGWPIVKRIVLRISDGKYVLFDDKPDAPAREELTSLDSLRISGRVVGALTCRSL